MSEFGSKPGEQEWTLYVCPQCGITHLELEAFRHGHCAYCCARAERVRVAPVEDLETRCREVAVGLREIASSGPSARQARELRALADKLDEVLGSSGRPEKQTDETLD